MFNRLDTSDDRRIDSTEFAKGAEMVSTWGVKLPSEGFASLDDEFAAIDIDDGGKILFDEFSKCAAPTPPPRAHTSSATRASHASRASGASGASRPASLSP